jgi:Uma2 family endonuclease
MRVAAGVMTAGGTVRRFTVDEYDRMGEAGILGEDDRVELVDGQVVEMTPIGPLHAGTVNRINRVLSSRLGERAVVGVQNPVRLAAFDSEPQPDAMLLRPRDDFYTKSHPGPDDVILVIEVMDASAAYDRGVKLPLYARAGVPEVWLLDLERAAMEVHRRPGPDGYADARVLRGPESLSAELVPDVAFRVSDFLG